MFFFVCLCCLFGWLFCCLFCLRFLFLFVFRWAGFPTLGQELYFRRGLNTWYLLQFDLLTAAIVAMSAAMVEKKLESWETAVVASVAMTHTVSAQFVEVLVPAVTALSLVLTLYHKC